ncbi:MAG: phosphatase PAP2 family protein [Halobacteriales archaeon]|nr:phosphatase PAP2 family protein [Halobacteriales archaeon]
MNWQLWRDPATRPAALAAAAAAAFALVLLDTALRGPMSAALDPLNAVVSSWRDGGLPVHAVGRELSKVGDFIVLFPILALAVGLAVGARAWRHAVGIAVAALCGPGAVALLQPVLTPLNRPMAGLDPLLIPDTDSPPRVAGGHLFPSGHLTEAALDWGLLLFVAVPLAAAAYGASARTRGNLRRVSVAAWVLAALLTAAGRILRQAHGANDVLAGWLLGCALLGTALWLLGKLRGPMAQGLRRRATRVEMARDAQATTAPESGRWLADVVGVTCRICAICGTVRSAANAARKRSLASTASARATWNFVRPSGRTCLASTL